MKRWDAHLARVHVGQFAYVLVICCGLGLLVDLGFAWKELDWSARGLYQHIQIQALPFLLLTTPFVFFLSLHLVMSRLHENHELALCQMYSRSTWDIGRSLMFASCIYTLLWLGLRELVWVPRATSSTTMEQKKNPPLLLSTNGEQLLLTVHPASEDTAGPLFYFNTTSGTTMRIPVIEWRMNQWHIANKPAGVDWSSGQWQHLLGLIPPPLHMLGQRGDLQTLPLPVLFAHRHSMPDARSELLKRCSLPLLYLLVCLGYAWQLCRTQKERVNQNSIRALSVLLLGIFLVYALG